MTHHVLLAVSLLTVLCSPSALLAQDAEQAAREAAFSELMSGCKMVGVFTTQGSKTPPQPETYELGEVTKVEGAKWRIKAKIQYAKKLAMTVPVTVDVNWAGDTPMIQVTDLKIPLMGTFTARVLFFRGAYAGTWSAKDHGGHMYGKVIPAAKQPPPAPAAVEADDPKPGVGGWTQYRGDALNTGVSHSRIPDWRSGSCSAACARMWWRGSCCVEPSGRCTGTRSPSICTPALLALMVASSWVSGIASRGGPPVSRAAGSSRAGAARPTSRAAPASGGRSCRH
ncbi:MAG: hypothetical protein HRU14_16855, partial [Planctomycetes bacterium]|nr:hypothetical protein [Planctomycetota bacterium]